MMQPAKNNDWFNNLDTTIRGTAGEEIVQAYLQAKGWDIFPHAPGVKAKVDSFAMRPNTTGIDVIAVEIKTYARRYAYNQTGIDIADYFTYCEIIKTVPLTIVFVDAYEECLYGLPLHKTHERAIFEGNKCYFHLSDCQKMRDLTRAELSSIGWTKNIDYTNVPKFFI
jgi:hypothetical protein